MKKLFLIFTAVMILSCGNLVFDAVDKKNVVHMHTEIYIADTNNNRIVKIDDMSGTNWVSLGGPASGSGVGQFDSPRGIAVGNDGKIYIADAGLNNRIVRMDDMAGTNWVTYTNIVQIANPYGIKIGSDGKIYIADNTGSHVVRMDNMSGANLVSYGTSNPCYDVALDTQGRIYYITGDSKINRIDNMSGAGWIPYSFNYGNGICLDDSGRIYIAWDSGAASIGITRIDDMSGVGAITLTKGYGGSYGVAVSIDNKIYFAEGRTGAYGTIYRADDMSGTNLVSFGSLGSGVGQFQNPQKIAILSQER